MRGFLLDTNVVAEALRRSPWGPVQRWLAAAPDERLFLSVLSVGEFEKGLAYMPAAAPGKRDLRRQLRALEAGYGDRILPITRAVVRRWGKLSGTIKRATGQTPPPVDILIAATAIESRLYLATRNVRDMARTGAVLFNPWLDDPASFPLT